MNPNFEIVDLSVPFAPDMPKYPAAWFPKFGVSELRPDAMPEASWKRRFTKLDLFVHNGTHVETSDHAFRDGRTVCTYALDRFCGRPYVIDLTDVPKGAAIDEERMHRELSQLNMPERAILLLRTGYDDEAWGTDDFWDRSPYLSPEAAQLLAAAKVGFVGLDFQTEKPGEKAFIVHKTLLGAGAILCEYLFRLDRVSNESFFAALPISIREVEASPVRAVALNYRKA